MGTIKDRMVEKQKIFRRGGKNPQKNYPKKDLPDPVIHDGVITQLEPDILECEIKWALESSFQFSESKSLNVQDIQTYELTLQVFQYND